MEKQFVANPDTREGYPAHNNAWRRPATAADAAAATSTTAAATVTTAAACARYDVPADMRRAWALLRGGDLELEPSIMRDGVYGGFEDNVYVIKRLRWFHQNVSSSS
eukprot:gene6667-biopygen7853